MKSEPSLSKNHTRIGEDMSRRLKITLPDPVCQHLTELAQETGESLAGVTVRIVLSKIEDGGAKRRGRSLVRSAYRERCLHPGHARSDGSTTAAVRRLCERYPETLSNLTEEWRANESQLETLLALAAWRSAIDEQGGDPRGRARVPQLLVHLQPESWGRRAQRRDEADIGTRRLSHRACSSATSAAAMGGHLGLAPSTAGRVPPSRGRVGRQGLQRS